MRGGMLDSTVDEVMELERREGCAFWVEGTEMEVTEAGVAKSGG